MFKYFFVLIFLLSFTISAQQKALSGKVTTYSGTPVESLTVVLENNGMPEAETYTDVAGNYALSVNAGTYTALRVRNQNKDLDSVPSTIEQNMVSNITITNDTSVDLTLPKYVHIYGVAKDADSSILQNAKITIKKWDGSEMTPWDEDYTDSLGNYSLFMEPGGVKIWITPSGGTEVTIIDTFTVDTQTDLIMPALSTVSGTVTTYNGTPLPYITVAIEKDMEQYETETDSSGNYSKTVNPGLYRIRLRNGMSMNGTAEGVPATMEEYKIDSINLTGDTTLNLAADYYPTVRCSVVDANGAVESVGITSKQWQGSEMTPWDHDTTGPNGICTLWTVDGNNKLWIYPPEGNGYVESSFEVTTNSDTTIVITLSQGAILTGKIFLSDSTPVSGLTMAIEKDMDQWETTTDSSGSYTFTMEDGVYRLRVRNMNNSSIEGVPSTLEHYVYDSLNLTGEMTVNIYLPFFPNISGTIKAPDGSPVPNVYVEGKQWDGAEMTPWDNSTTDSLGNYSLTLDEGMNKIWITPSDSITYGEFSFIETFTENTIKDIYLPNKAKGITRFQPSTITRGHSGEVMITGIGIDFTAGIFTLDLGDDIIINSISVVSAITATADISISDTAETGSRAVLVTSNSEDLVGPNMLTITAKAEENVILDSIGKTIEKIEISDGAGNKLVIPAGTDIDFPAGSDSTISYESPILQGEDPTINEGELTEIQKELEPSGLIFNDTVFMIVQYSDQDVEGIKEEELKPFFYVDDSSGTGTIGDSLIVLERDTAANALSVVVPHFSMFRLSTSQASNPISSIKNQIFKSSLINYSTNGTNRISFSVFVNSSDANKDILLQIVNMKGATVKTLVSGKLGTGTHNIQINETTTIASGNYIISLSIDKHFKQSKQFVIIK